MITIRSINGEILTHFDNSVPDGNPYFEPVMTDDMESLVSSFSFSVPLEVEDSVYLQGLNQVLTKDRYGDLRLFIITDVYEEWTTVGGSVKVDCEDISISEMNDIVVSPFNGISFEDTLNKTFNNSGWTLQYGANWKDVDNTTFVLEEYDNMRSVIASIIDTYGCQFKFLAQENQYGEITRVVEVFKTRGVDTGKYFYYDRDLLGIERDIQHSNIKTAIHPYYTGYNGKTYTLYDFYPVNPDPDFQKDKKSTLIINKEASKLYDDGNSYRIMPYKAEVEGDPELVYREAIKELKKYAEPIYTYKVNVILLQNLYGWDGEDIELGDTVWMKERVGNRELGLEARVTAYEYHEDDPSADVVTFSNFKEIDTTDAKEIAERIFIAYANSADGKVDFSIDDSTNRAYMGVYTSATKTQSTDPDTYTWSRTKGEDGNSAPTLDLTSSQQVMKLKSDGTPDGEQTIIFTAIKQNSTEAIVWEAIPYKGNVVQPAITLDGTGDVKTLDSSQWDKDWTRLQVTVTMGNLKDIQTIVMVSDGATGASGTAIVGFLTNESTTFAANPEGVVDDYSNGSGRFVIYEGTKEVTSGVVYTKVSNVGINFLINATTGEYIVSNMTQDHAQAVVKAVYKEVTITKFLSFSKSRQGQAGEAGTVHTAYSHVGSFPEFVQGARPNEYRMSEGVTLLSNNSATFPIYNTFMVDGDGRWFTRAQRSKPTLNPNTLSMYNTIPVPIDQLERNLVGKRVMISARFRASQDIDRFTLMSAYVTSSGTVNLPMNDKEVKITSEFLEYSDVIENWVEGITTLRFCPRQPLGLQDVTDITVDMSEFKLTVLEPEEEAIPDPWIPPISRPLKNIKNIFDGGNGRDFVSAASSIVTNTHNITVSEWGVSDAVTTKTTGGTSVNKASLHVKPDVFYYADGNTYYAMRIKVRNNSTTDVVSVVGNATPYNQNNTQIPPSKSVWAYLPVFLPTKDSAITMQLRVLSADKNVDVTWSNPEIYEYNIDHGFTTTPPTPNLLEYLGVSTISSPKPSENPADYSWSLIKGADGEQGIAGQKGEDGRTPYFHTAYTNSTDFRNYDYSGNPNLLPKINKSAFTLGTGGSVTDGDDNEVIFTLDGSGQLLKYDTRFKLPPLLNGETYTISCEIKFHSDVVGDLKNIKLVYNYLPGGATMIDTDRPLTDPTLNKWIKLKGTRQVQYTANAPQQWYIVLLDFISANRITGTISLRNIKVEKGSTATPYQPNLLDAPYYLSKVALGENIANPTKTFPINTSAYLVYTGANTEPYIAGQKYTVTMKATKPATQTFNVFIDSGSIGVGSMTPVEGLTDVWQKTFTVSQANINAGVTNRLAIYQVPNSSVGDVQIDWLKIEKGDTRTPNIDSYKYLGNYTDFEQADSLNPTKYSWSLIKGTDGADGKPAQLLTVQSDTPVMRFDSNDGVIAGQVVTFNAFKQGIESSIVWKATPYKGNTAQPDIILGGTGDTRTLNGSQWASGVTTIKVNVNAGGFTDTVTITKVKDGAKGDKGDSGADGIAGKDGVGLKSTTVNYAPSASGTVAPASGWQAQVPTVAPNNFLWTRTEWTYTDNSTEVGYSVAKMGADGAKGDDGIAGKDGVGIDETLIEYAFNTSGSVKPTSGWSTSIPVVPAGQYLWTRTTWTYTDGTNEQGFTVAKQGEKGDKGDTGASGKDGIAGKDGVGIKTTAISYAGSSNGTTAPVTGWQEQVPTVAPNNFLWTRTVWTYTDNSTETGYSVAKMGADGAKGDDGIAGKDGVGIVSTVIEYATSTSGTTKPLTGWTTTVPTVPQGNFLWTRTTWNYSDDTSEQGFTVARQGSNGSNGADAYSPILTNESTTFAASPTGVVTDWSVGNGVFMVYRGTTRVTTGVTYAVESVSNSEGTINASTGAYSITNLTKDNGTITFKATIGSVVLTKTMSLSKSRQGLEGAQGAQGIQGVRGVAIYNPTEPSGDIEEGATWFQTESATNDLVIAMYTRKSGVWVKTPVAAGALQVEQLSAISADIGNVTAGNILGIKITGSEFLQTWNIDQGTEVQKGETRLYNGAIRQIDSVTNKTTGNVRVYSTATISNGEINGTRNVKWDDGSIRQLANLTISGAEISMYNSEEGVGYQGTITAKALTNIGWKTLQMGSLFEAKESNPPQYKVIWQLDGTRIIKFRGQFGLKSGNMTANTSYYPFRSENTASSGTSYVPAEIIPNRTAFGYGATSAYHGGRLAMTTAPNLLFNSAEAVSYCSLESFQYIIE